MNGVIPLASLKWDKVYRKIPFSFVTAKINVKTGKNSIAFWYWKLFCDLLDTRIHTVTKLTLRSASKFWMLAQACKPYTLGGWRRTARSNLAWAIQRDTPLFPSKQMKGSGLETEPSVQALVQYPAPQKQTKNSHWFVFLWECDMAEKKHSSRGMQCWSRKGTSLSHKTITRIL